MRAACIYASGGDSDATATAKPGPPYSPADAGTRTTASARNNIRGRTARPAVTGGQLRRRTSYRGFSQ